jgi:hypothetical protein
MKTISRNCCWPAVLMMLGAAFSVSADDSVGVARLSDYSSQTVVRGQSPISDTAEGDFHPEESHAGSIPEGQYTEGYCPEGYCPEGYYVECPPYYCPPPLCYHCSVLSNNCLAAHLRCHCMNFRMRNQIASAHLMGACHQKCLAGEYWFRNKFGYFFPTGCCGRGCPPMGHYSMVYPLDPNYFDQRDGNIYAAQGYGGPVAVPLAPNVRFAYNYGWGVPSSRLTPISHPYVGP